MAVDLGTGLVALAAGAAFGFYGTQTMAAETWFNGIYHCGM